MKTCLNMIVRNESRIIEKCLRSALPHIDAWVICDTGSTDDTVGMIERFFDSHQVPGEIVRAPFVDFSQARNAALDACRRSKLEFDYILLADADMELVGPRQDLTGRVYSVEQRSGNIGYWNTRIVHRMARARYVEPTHEYLSVDGHPERLAGVWFIDHANGASRPEKFERDCNLLKKALQENPGNVRAMFYLARTLDDMGSKEEAIKFYDQRAAAGNFEEEAWYAATKAAECCLAVGRTDEFIVRSLAAYQRRPQRAEPLCRLAEHWFGKENLHLTYMFARSAYETPYPKDDVLFIRQDIYGWKAADLVAISAFYAGDRSIGEAAARKALAGGPTDQWGRLEKNLSFYVPRQPPALLEPIDVAPLPSTDRPTIMTSFYTNRIDVQLAAARSWIDLGFDVFSINTIAEIEQLAPLFVNVNVWFIPMPRSGSSMCGRDVPFIVDMLAMLATSSSRVVGIVTSDIILRGHETLADVEHEVGGGSFVLCHRIDIDTPDSTDMLRRPATGTRGIDAFFFDTKTAKLLADKRYPFCLGMPYWDTWIPAEAERVGRTLVHMHDTAFHPKHPTTWLSRSDVFESVFGTFTTDSGIAVNRAKQLALWPHANERGSRAGNMYRAAERHAEQGHYDLAAASSQPNKDLYPEYRHAFQELSSNSGHRATDPTVKRIARNDCFELSIAGPASSDARAVARSNIKFYVEPFRAEFTQLTVDTKEGFVCMNPSVTGDHTLVRTVNYQLNRGVYTAPGNIIRTVNYLDGREIQDCTGLAYATAVQGLEDCRIFDWQGGLWCVGCWCVVQDGKYRRKLVLARIDDGRLVDPVMLESIEWNEKNWVPLVDDDKLYFVYNATTVLAVDKTCRYTVVKRGDPTPLEHLRGGSQAIRYRDGWLYVSHEVIHGTDRIYLHRFVHLNHDFSVARVSDPFFWKELGIEFCAGLAVRDGRFVASFGLSDKEAWLATIDADSIEGTFRAV